MEDLEPRIEPRSSPGHKLRYWLPPILWLAAIFFFSTDSFSGENTGNLLRKLLLLFGEGWSPEQFGRVHYLIRKAGHFTEYGILAWLLFRAFRSSSDLRWHWRWLIYSLLIIVTYALLDEYHQSFTRTRGSSVYDSFIDMSGGLAVLLVIWLKRRRG